MCAILLSINPSHVEKIMDGTKRYEFRKKVCKRHVDKILIYSTTPVMSIVGEAEVEDILIDNPEKIWRRTKREAGIDKIFFDSYYKDKQQAVAYKLKNVVRYEPAKKLEEYGISSAPQSYRYIKE